jgi:large subunit ribosomal protein L28
VDVHGLAEVPDDPLGAQAAGLNFVRISPFTMQHLLIAHGHAAPTNPILAVARVNMVEIGQTDPPGMDTLSEYQIGCGGNPELDRLGLNQGATIMAKVCEVCGRGPQFGNRISHAHNVSKRRWNLNLQSVRALINGAGKRIKVCTSCIRDGKVLKAGSKVQKPTAA